MRIYVTEDYNAMSRKAAAVIASNVTLKPDCVLGLATGSTPIGTYKQLYEWCKAGDLDFSEVRTVNLDEYVGLPVTHQESYRRFMQQNLFDHINIKPENTHLPDGLAADLEAECAKYNGIIKSLGGIDMQLLGMGHNGHIGFNEPADAFELETHVVELSQRTIEANSRFFPTMDDVPKRALTMGIKTIMNAKQILMVVSGADKADIVKAAFTGPVTPKVQASILQMHPNVIVVGDKAAMSKL